VNLDVVIWRSGDLVIWLFVIEWFGDLVAWWWQGWRRWKSADRQSL